MQGVMVKPVEENKKKNNNTQIEAKTQKWASVLLWLAHIDTVHMPAVKLAMLA